MHSSFFPLRVGFAKSAAGPGKQRVRSLALVAVYLLLLGLQGSDRVRATSLPIEPRPCVGCEEDQEKPTTWVTETSDVSTEDCTTADGAAGYLDEAETCVPYETSENTDDGCNSDCTDSGMPVCTETGGVYVSKCKAECDFETVAWECPTNDMVECSQECSKAQEDSGGDSSEGSGGSDTGGSTDNGSGRPPMPPILPSKPRPGGDQQYRNNTEGSEGSGGAGTQDDSSTECMCTDGGAPLCARSGKVYPNGCYAKCASDKKRFNCGTRSDCAADCAAAVTAEKSCNCPTKHSPVCATNGKVYKNACLAKCYKTGVQFQCKGTACQKQCSSSVKAASTSTSDDTSDCFCTLLYLPVCGMDGKVYSNGCMAGCVKAAVRFDCGTRKNCRKDCKAAAQPKPSPTPKPKPPIKPIGCQCGSAPRKPVCSKDGKVYPSLCQLQCVRAPPARFFCGKRKNCARDCERQASAVVGPCKCPARQQEVCATTGKLYYNSCLAKCHKAKVRFECGRKKNCAGDCKKAVK